MFCQNDWNRVDIRRCRAEVVARRKFIMNVFREKIPVECIRKQCGNFLRRQDQDLCKLHQKVSAERVQGGLDPTQWYVPDEGSNTSVAGVLFSPGHLRSMENFVLTYFRLHLGLDVSEGPAAAGTLLRKVNLFFSKVSDIRGSMGRTSASGRTIGAVAPEGKALIDDIKSSAAQKVSELHLRLDKGSDDLKRLESEMLESKARSDKRIGQLRSELSEQRLASSSLQKASTDLKQRHGEELAALQKKVTEAASLKQRHGEDLAALQKKVTEAASLKQRHGEELAALQKKVTEAASLKQQHGEAMGVLKERLSAGEAKMALDKIQLTKLSSLRNSETLEKDNLVKKLVEKLRDAEQKASVQRDDLVKKKSKLSIMEDGVRNLVKKMKKMKLVSTTSDERSTALQLQLDAAEKRRQELQVEVEGLKSTLLPQEQKVNDLTDILEMTPAERLKMGGKNSIIKKLTSRIIEEQTKGHETQTMYDLEVSRTSRDMKSLEASLTGIQTGLKRITSMMDSITEPSTS